MRSDDVLERVKAKLAELGVPKHISDVRRVPSSVRVQLFIRNSLWSLDLRRGITAPELDQKLNHLADVWERARPGPPQIDLEAYLAGVAAADRMDLEGMIETAKANLAKQKASK